jgi:hypothetical protein
MWEQPKLMLPYMITRLAAYLDERESLYFINVTTGGYGLTLREGAPGLAVVGSLLNSRLLDFYLKQVSTTFHGGYFAANKQYVEQLPIVTPRDARTRRQLTELAGASASLRRDLNSATAKPPQEKEQLRRQIEATDRQTDQLVYALYGLTDAEIKIVEEATAAKA